MSNNKKRRHHLSMGRTKGQFSYVTLKIIFGFVPFFFFFFELGLYEGIVT